MNINYTTGQWYKMSSGVGEIYGVPLQSFLGPEMRLVFPAYDHYGGFHS